MLFATMRDEHELYLSAQEHFKTQIEDDAACSKARMAGATEAEVSQVGQLALERAREEAAERAFDAYLERGSSFM